MTFQLKWNSRPQEKEKERPTDHAERRRSEKREKQGILRKTAEPATKKVVADGIFITHFI
jgi:hypothetical protein